jgi:predicted RNA binding protein YcfA (HicA-like mRNA interferase family)
MLEGKVSNQFAVAKTVIEALEARGFSGAEARQMIRRIREGDPINKQIDDRHRQDAYNMGFQEGRRKGMYEAYALAQQAAVLVGARSAYEVVTNG